MRVLFLLILLQTLFYGKVLSQTEEYFHLEYPSGIVSGSYYNKISFVDSRPNTVNLGFVYSKKAVRKMLVFPERPFQEQFNDLILYCSDSTAKKGELFIQFLKFEFIDILRRGQDYSYCELRIRLYGNTNGSYRELATLNATILEEQINKKELFKRTSEAITTFILNNLRFLPDSAANFSHNEILKIDSIEKSDLRLYNETYVDGIYRDFETFKTQSPGFKIRSVVFDRERVERVTYIDSRGKTRVLDPRSSYAFVYSGKPYISSGRGHYLLQKKQNDFFFKGEFAAIPEPNHGSIVLKTVTNITGALTSEGTRFYEMRLDYYDGSFIQIKEYK